MKFMVIYSVDVPASEKIGYHRPRGRAWTLTEGDEQYELSYLEGDWARGKHRKWISTLTRRQFDAWASEHSMVAEDVETGGSLTDAGWLPAISFHCEDQYHAHKSAYVTPIPNIPPPKTARAEERAWDRVRAAILSMYK